MKIRLSVLATVAAVALTACAGHHIPGTEIRETPDTQAIYGVIEAYRAAAERREPDAILALVSTQYFDDAGTPDPADDLDYAQLQRVLPAQFQKVSAMRLGITVREIQVNGDHATANLFYDGHYRLTTQAGETAKAASDLSQMRFVRENGTWKIVSGL
jgi:hypothetical protein